MLATSIILLSTLISNCLALFVTVDANDEECFFERLKKNDHMGLMFEVTEGGFLDIDMTVPRMFQLHELRFHTVVAANPPFNAYVTFQLTGPDGRVMHKVERETSMRFMFAATLDGVYTYCFGNRMSTLTPKVVQFNAEIIQITVGTPSDVKDDAHQLPRMLMELKRTLTLANREQAYMEVRERIHRRINDDTNTRVVVWAAFEALLLTTLTAGQIYYMKRFFEVRRIV